MTEVKEHESNQINSTPEDKKEEVKKYKFGAKDLDLNTYIYNISNNVLSYIDHKVKYDHWNDSLVLEFSNAYRQYLLGLEQQRDSGVARFSTDSLGSIIDSTGQLSDQDSDNTYYNKKGEAISELDYNNLRHRKQKRYNTFEANREVAAFFNKVGKGTLALMEEKQKPLDKFDLAKHGFINYWQTVNNPGGGTMELRPYLDMDAFDKTTGKRAVDKRAKYLASEINNYLALLKDYDYEGSPFKTSDLYKGLLKKAAAQLANGVWNNEDLMALNQAGISGDFYNTFFSTEENPMLSAAEKDKLKTEADEKKKKEEAEKLLQLKKAMILEQLDIFDRNNYIYSSSNPYNIGILANSGYFDANGVFDKAKFGDSLPAGTDLQTYMNNYLANPWNNVEASRAWAGLIGYNVALPVLGNEELAGYYYVPLVSDRQKNSVLVYNPSTGSSFHTFIGNIPNLWNNIVKDWEIKQGIKDRADGYMFKEGGTLPKHLLGGGVNLNAIFELDRQQRLTDTGKSNTFNTSYHNGRDAEQQEAGNRKTFADPTLENPENGFSGTDMLRLGTIAADIVSMGSAFVPVYGTAVSAITGVGSSIGTFFADAFEDGLDWGDVKNLGANLGMDALGLIPGGGAASKGLKIAKTLGKYATRIIATVGATHTIANGDKIIGSYQKLLSEPSELSVDDWRNISAGLGLITGGTAAATRKYKKAKQEAQMGSKVKDHVAVEMLNSKGEKKTVMFAGEDAKLIRDADKSGDFKKLLDATVNKYERFRGWSLPEHNSFKLQSPFKKWGVQSPVTYKPTRSNVYDVKADANGVYVDKGKWKADEYINGSDKQVQNVIGNGKKALLQSDIDVQIADHAKLLDSELKRVASVSDKFKEGIPTLRKRIERALKEKTALSESLNGRSSEHLQWQYLRKKSPVTLESITQLEAEINALLPQVKKGKARKKALEAKEKKQGLTAEEGREWTTLKNNEIALNKKLDRVNKLKEILEVQNLEHSSGLKDKRIAEAESIILGINNKTFHSARYNNMIQNRVKGTGDDAKFIFLPSKFRDPVIEGSLKEMLLKYNIIYKKGGTLDLQRVKKYEFGSSITTVPRFSSLGLDQDDNLGNKPINFSLIRSFFPKPSSIIELVRFGTRLKGNETLIDLAKKANIPFYQDPIHTPSQPITGDINAIIDADKSAGTLNTAAQKTVTTDINKQQSFALSALALGEGLKLLGNAIDRNTANKSKDLNYLAAVNENKTNHDISQQNELAGLLAMSNDYKLDESEVAQSMQNKDNYYSAHELDLRLKETKQELVNRQYALKDIQEAVKHNLLDFATLSEDEIKAWDLYISGAKTPSELLSDATLGKAYMSAFRKASQAELEQLRILDEVPDNKWSRWQPLRSLASNTPEWEGTYIPISKKGSKLALAKIKAREQDNKNYLKIISESNKRHDKALDRISKSLYGYVKAIIVK